MKLLNIGKTDAGTDVTLDIDILRTSHLLVQGASGSGKSYTLRKIAEEAVQQIQTIIIDPEGEYHTLREKFPFVLVGKGGEAPALIGTAGMLARRLLETGASTICDLYGLERDDRQEWLKLFITSLMNLPREMWRPLLIIVDETHLFAAERNQDKDCHSRAAMEDLCSRGRKRGIGIVLATQRITKVSNNCVSECQNYLIGRTFMPDDRERAAKALGISGKVDKNLFFDDLKVLNKGQFWGLGVAIAMERTRVAVDHTLTTHPKPGEAQEHRPPMPDDVKAMLPQLADLEEDEESSGSDDSALVEELRARLNTKEDMSAWMAGKLERSEAEVKQLREAVAAIANSVQEALGSLDHASDVVKALKENRELAVAIAPTSVLVEVAARPFDFEDSGANIETIGAQCELERRQDVVQDVRPVQDVTNVTNVTSSVHSPNNGHNNGHVTLSAGARKLFSAMHAYPKGLSRGQAKILCGYAERTLVNYISELRVAGLLVSEGGLLKIVPGKQHAIGGFRPMPVPRNTKEVLDVWNDKLTSGAHKLLKVLVAQRGAAVSRDNAMQVCSFAERTLVNYISELSTAGLLVRTHGGIAAKKEVLFL